MAKKAVSVKSSRGNQSSRDVLAQSKALKRIRRRALINSFFMSRLYFGLLVLFTLYSLYSADLQLAIGSNRTTDNVWNAFTIITIIFFLVDIAVQGYYRTNCWRTSGFYIEIVALLSLVLDLTWLWDSATVDNWVQGNNYQTVLAEAKKFSALQQNVFWYMRFLRYLRFMFLINFFQGVIDRSDYYEDQMSQQQAKGSSSFQVPNRPGTFDLKSMKRRFLTYPTLDLDEQLVQDVDKVALLAKDDEPEVHNTSRSFTYNNIKRAMYLNILVMVLVPLFLMVTFAPVLTSGQAAANQVQYLATKNQLASRASAYYANLVLHTKDTRNQFVFIGVYNNSVINGTRMLGYVSKAWTSDTSQYKNNTITDVDVTKGPSLNEMTYIQAFRLGELLIRTSPEDLTTVPDNGLFTVTIYSNLWCVRVDSGVSIARTSILIVLLILTVYFFYNDSKKLLLKPFADMLANIRKIEENPMSAAKEMQLEIDELDQKAEFNRSLKRELAELRKYETNVLTSTLAKSGQLLALGFGEAGINIILEKLTKGSEMVGKKVICLFGFADIKYFTEVSERLKEDVMTFVNEIAEIVSPIVDKFTGGTNKNLGEAFLFVWKFREEDTITMFDYDAEGNLHKNVKLKEYSDKNNPITDRCDLALLSFLECIVYVYKSPTLAKYRSMEKLQDLDHFRVKNSFGLHIGWAIEGAIGSEYKIDASYLSPNVNLASRVQYATKQFGVYILVSGMVHDLLSKEIQVLMREIDCVELKGSKLAMHLWTYDMDLSILSQADGAFNFADDKLKVYSRLKRERMIEYRKDLKYFHQQFYEGRISGKTMFLSQKEVIDVHRTFPKRFYDDWNAGYRLYIAGEWEQCVEYFERTKDMIPGYHDKPSEVILGFLKAANYQKPSYWAGVRKLTSK